MSTRNFTPQEFARDGARQAVEDWKLVAAEAVGITIERAAPIAIAITEGIPHRDPNVMDLHESWFFFERGRFGTKRQLPIGAARSVTYKFGSAYGIASDAPHAAVINRGRLPLKTGRMGGSEKAARGIINPLHARVSSQVPSIITEAGQRAERRMRTG